MEVFFELLDSKKHLKPLKSLVADCADYFLLETGTNPSDSEIQDLFVDVPPNMPVSSLELIGVFSKEKALIGALWVITWI